MLSTLEIDTTFDLMNCIEWIFLRKCYWDIGDNPEEKEGSNGTSQLEILVDFVRIKSEGLNTHQKDYARLDPIWPESPSFINFSA